MAAKPEPDLLKDAFGVAIAMGDTVLYSTQAPSGSRYHIGVIVKVYPSLPANESGYACPARVAVQNTLSSDSYQLITKPAILNTTNVVKYKPEPLCQSKS